MNNQKEQTNVWQKLHEHAGKLKQIHLNKLFSSDPQRKHLFSQQHEELFIDYSRNFLTTETIQLFKEIADSRDLKNQIAAMFNGAKVNYTENQVALHTALRCQEDRAVFVDHRDIIKDIKNQLARMLAFVNNVLEGKWRGFSGKPITDIVNIGIGGSHLGPALVTEALTNYRTHLKVHFVSNADGLKAFELTRQLEPETTLFIVASKSFSTRETLLNAELLLNWFISRTGHSPFARHVIGVSANKEKMQSYGIPLENQFYIEDSIGGRYSVWSCIGLSAALAIGSQHFIELLQGSYSIDKHFREKDYHENIPFILALLDIFYINGWKAQTRAILPYHSYLKKLSAYLQQLSMESLGKSVNRLGETVTQDTGNVIWGELGNDGQHAFYQLLHQGTLFIPIDLIVPIQLEHNLITQAQFNFANAIAQATALMQGKTEEQVYSEMKNQGYTGRQIEALLPYRVYSGNRPSTMIIFSKLTPRVLGQLLTLYEHKVFVQSVIWDINPFDQWGVELGKTLADKFFKNLEDEYRHSTQIDKLSSLLK